MSPQLAAHLADQETAECAAVDKTMHSLFGKDESKWSPSQTDTYLGAIARVHAAFHPEGRAA